MSVVSVFNPRGKSQILFICEHASNAIPEEFDNLGLEPDVLQSHIAWDLGVLDTAKKMASRLESKLIYSTISRLVYDCNRPPTAIDAMPAQSEIFEVPGNKNLNDADREERTKNYYVPFQQSLAEHVVSKDIQVIVTMHSFTSVYHGKERDVEVGILHDSDSRFADAMLTFQQDEYDFVLRRNEPYGAEDGVTHTLIEHGIRNNLLNVMIEVRNDLLVNVAQQDKIVDYLCKMIEHALTQLSIEKNEAKL